MDINLQLVSQKRAMIAMVAIKKIRNVDADSPTTSARYGKIKTFREQLLG